MSQQHDEPWRRLRDLEPPLGSQRRVLLQAQEEVQSPTPGRRRWLLPTAITAGIAVAVALLLILRSGGSLAPSQVAMVPSANDAAMADTPEPMVPEPLPTMEADTPELLVVANDELTIRLPKASITVSGPAAVKTTTRGLKIREGRVKVAGFALVEGPGCDVSIDGEAIVELVGKLLQTRVLSGSATATSSSCTVSHAVVLIDRTKEKPVEKPVIGTESNKLSSIIAIDSDASPPPTSMLRQQLDEYKLARTLLGSDPGGALKELRAFVEHWPDTLLREEAEAGVIEALLTLGKKQEARKQIEVFGARYPTSRRTSRLQERAQ